MDHSGAEAGGQADLNRRTIAASAGGLVAGKSIDNISTEVLWVLTQRVYKALEISLTQ